MGGTINVFSRPPEPWHLDLGADGGNAGQVELYGGFSHLWGHFGVSAHVRSFTMDGYYIVPEANRGPVDQLAGVRIRRRRRSGSITSAARNKIFLRLDTLAEKRKNGTALTPNSTGLGSLAASWAHDSSQDGLLVSAYHTRENYHAWFSAIGAGRRTETLSFMQHAPSDETGVAGLWRHTTSRWTTLIGGDVARTAGSSTDYLIPTGIRFGEGMRWSRGFFGAVERQGRTGPMMFLGAPRRFHRPGQLVLQPEWRRRGRQGTLPRARFGVPQLPQPDAERALPHLPRRQRRHQRQSRTCCPRNLFGAEGGLRPGRRDAPVQRYRFPQFARRRDHECHPEHDPGADHPAAAECGDGRDARRGSKSSPAPRTALAGRALVPVRGFALCERTAHPAGREAAGLGEPHVDPHADTFISGGLRAYSLQFEDDLNTLPLAGFSTVQFSARHRLIAAPLGAVRDGERARPPVSDRPHPCPANRRARVYTVWVSTGTALSINART